MKPLILVAGASLALKAPHSQSNSDEAIPMTDTPERELIERVRGSSLTFRNGNPVQPGDTCVVKSDDLIALCDTIEALLSRVDKLEERVRGLEGLAAQNRVDILTTLGALRDQMPSEAVAIFQRIAKDAEASLNRSAS